MTEHTNYLTGTLLLRFSRKNQQTRFEDRERRDLKKGSHTSDICVRWEVEIRTDVENWFVNGSPNEIEQTRSNINYYSVPQLSLQYCTV